MLAEFFLEIILYIFGWGICGLFQRARSAKSLWLKCAAWGSLLSSVALFVVTATLAQGNMITVTVLSGFALLIGFIVFGIGAAVENAKVMAAETDAKKGTDEITR